ncbi:6-phospho-beta-glucosidase [Actinomadura verrucosospora]|uniref:6-phospho-beta-glucosidase n=1 Tax=Actinomadura verrucosospora TaxID=46165 RepID=A0A7D4A072_ACTVE|nr:6-phospho-beta-glucosidase [Actinomadura verrucosospora]QKG19345.1 6-phospho-beta-glucosidase [Actinomadura verrucosospora]
MKLTVIGGGSTYTPELVDGIARERAALPVSELVLADPDARRRELVGGLAARMLARAGHPAKVVTTGDLDEAVTGAAVVLVQLRVGGQAARLVDETLPLECGCVGQETTGAGGLAKALRTVPVVLDIAERVAARAPDAWIIDFTNPVGIVTRALLDAGHRAVGLCNVAIGVQRRTAALLDAAPERITLGHAGLNHLTWVRSLELDGHDVLPGLLDGHAAELAAMAGLPAPFLRRLGAVPSYYLRYFYEHDRVVREQRGAPARAEEVAALERDLLVMYADPALDTKPARLEERGGAYYSEAAVQLAVSLLTGRGDAQVVNVRNNGTLPFLDARAVIEVPARITSSGPVPLPVPPLEPLFSGLVAHVSGYEELALDAALRGGVGRVADALLAHPLVGQLDTADRLARDLVAANRAHLPWAA